MQNTICFFNSNLAWGGGEKWHLSTAKEFERRGYHSIIVANVDSELAKKASSEKINFYSFFINNLSFLNPMKILTMMAFFKTHKIEAVVMNLPSDLKLAGIAAKLAGVKTIVYRRGMPHPLKNSFLNRMLFKHVLTHVIVNSQEIGRSLQQNNESWFPKEKILLVYNGVNTRLPLNTEQKLYSKAGNEIVIGNAGRLTEQKGQKYLLEMAQILKAQGVHFHLLIAGEGELHRDLQNSLSQQNLDNEVTLLGHVEDMTAFMNSLDIFVFPSLFEGSANTLIETLHHGKPCIAFDISSNPEIIQHGVNGYLAKPFEASELAKYVMELSQNPARASEFVKKGESIILEKFDSGKNLDKLQKIL